mmetsp:Transcript_20000/g.71124  ORF Transcript_20000/g.71124 Transcript_20000/m.71124 type:complete len:273 (-) Transcript_20000:227-1045(-)
MLRRLWRGAASRRLRARRIAARGGAEQVGGRRSFGALAPIVLSPAPFRAAGEGGLRRGRGRRLAGARGCARRRGGVPALHGRLQRRRRRLLLQCRRLPRRLQALLPATLHPVRIGQGHGALGRRVPCAQVRIALLRARRPRQRLRVRPYDHGRARARGVAARGPRRDGGDFAVRLRRRRRRKRIRPRRRRRLLPRRLRPILLRKVRQRRAPKRALPGAVGHAQVAREEDEEVPEVQGVHRKGLGVQPHDVPLRRPVLLALPRAVPKLQLRPL